MLSRSDAHSLDSKGPMDASHISPIELQNYNGSPSGELPSGDAQQAETSASPSNSRASSLRLFGSWWFRAEAWDWFQPTSGRNNYVFAHSLLRAGIGQKRESFEWLIEGAQDAILGLPSNAIALGNQGQLGLGGTYYVANGNKRNLVGSIGEPGRKAE